MMATKPQGRAPDGKQLAKSARDLVGRMNEAKERCDTLFAQHLEAGKTAVLILRAGHDDEFSRDDLKWKADKLRTVEEQFEQLRRERGVLRELMVSRWPKDFPHFSLFCEERWKNIDRAALDLEMAVMANLLETLPLATAATLQDDFPPGWEFQRGRILTPFDATFETTAKGMRLREETVIPSHPVRNASELLDHLRRWHAEFMSVLSQLRIATEARVDDEAVAEWTARLFDETGRELRNARRAVREWIDEPERPACDDNPASIHDAERQLERLIDGLAPVISRELDSTLLSPEVAALPATLRQIADAIGFATAKINPNVVKIAESVLKPERGPAARHPQQELFTRWTKSWGTTDARTILLEQTLGQLGQLAAGGHKAPPQEYGERLRELAGRWEAALPPVPIAVTSASPADPSRREKPVDGGTGAKPEGMTWQQAKRDAEAYLRRNAWPGLNKLMKSIRCRSKSTFNTARKHSPVMRKKEAEFQATRKVVTPSQLSDTQRDGLASDADVCDSVSVDELFNRVIAAEEAPEKRAMLENMTPTQRREYVTLLENDPDGEGFFDKNSATGRDRSRTRKR